MYDVIVIGGGIVGCFIARELSKFKLKIALLEKNIELSTGTSKSNSGIVHAGFDCEPNTLKAKLNVKGNEMFPSIAKDLNIPFKNNGSFVLAFNKEDELELKKLYEKGIVNKVSNLSIVPKETVFDLEPNVSKNVTLALYAKTGGIISPYEATQALGENAFTNGVEFFLGEKVINIQKEKVTFKITTENNIFESKIIINCAGLYADEINNMISKQKYKITPRKGEYMLFDKSLKGFVNSTLFQVPSEAGKGVLVTPTLHGHLLIGPSSEFIDDKTNKKTHKDILDNIEKSALKTINYIPKDKLITSFTGLRANETHDDFVIEEASDVKGFINTLGINSPGLASSPAIAMMVVDLVSNIINLEEKKDFIKTREQITFIKDLNLEEQNKLIKKNPLYGKIICRCETITEGEIVDAINKPLGAKTLDGVKFITRAGMGRCQSGFCISKVLEILSRELGEDIYNITKSGKNSGHVLQELNPEKTHPKSITLIASPITMSCIISDLEKHIVLRQSLLTLVLKVRFFRSMV